MYLCLCGRVCPSQFWLSPAVSACGVVFWGVLHCADGGSKSPVSSYKSPRRVGRRWSRAMAKAKACHMTSLHARLWARKVGRRRKRLNTQPGRLSESQCSAGNAKHTWIINYEWKSRANEWTTMEWWFIYAGYMYKGVVSVKTTCFKSAYCSQTYI